MEQYMVIFKEQVNCQTSCFLHTPSFFVKFFFCLFLYSYVSCQSFHPYFTPRSTFFGEFLQLLLSLTTFIHIRVIGPVGSLPTGKIGQKISLGSRKITFSRKKDVIPVGKNTELSLPLGKTLKFLA